MASGDIILSDGTTLTPEDFRRIAVEVLKLIETNAKDPGQWEAVSSLQGVTSLPVFQVIGSTYKLVRVAVEILRGVDGREVELQVNKEGTHIQWRYTDDMWNNLIAIESLKGNPGDTPEFRKGPSGVEWKYVSEEDTAWRTLFAFEDLRWKFEDLTEEQIALFWQNLPDDVLALFQQPATEAAGVAIEAANKAESAAATATQTNEAMAAAELERQQAEESRVETETSRVQAESERVTAEQSRAEAEQSRNTAEQSRISAETERNESEIARKESETERISAEEGRKTAETARSEAEQQRVTAEEARAEAEQSRASAESERQTAEDARKEAENIRASSEELRKANENTRFEAEQKRRTAEETRNTEEQARITAESKRQTAETARARAETERASAEEERKIAEAAREGASRIAVENANEATDRANTASALSEELNAHPMKPQGGYWFRWNTETDAYENTGIQAKGDVGSSFHIVGRYDTLDELKQAVPDGTDVDGVYAIGTAEPYSYYAWVVVDGVWQWDNQGQLRGAEGKSSFEVWSELPENEGKTLDDYFDWLSPQIQNGNWFIQGTDTGIRAQAVDAKISESKNTETEYILHIKTATSEFNTPNLKGHSVQVKENAENTDKVYKLDIITSAGTLTTPNLRGNDGEKYVIPTLDHEPSETDLTWSDGGVIRPFEIGYMCRWFDPERGENGEYLFFQLNDISEGKALWKRAGSGGGDSETVTLNLSIDNNGDELINGLTFTLRYSNVSQTYQWNNQAIIISVPATQEYWFEFPDLFQYRTPKPVRYVAISGYVRQIDVAYEWITTSKLIFDKANASPANITGDINQGVFQRLGSRCRRCLVKPEVDGVAVCWLNDGNTNQYHDGTGALLDGSEGDVMTLLPGSYAVHQIPDVEHFRYDVSDEDLHGESYLHDNDTLVGTYKAVMQDGKLYSRSGVIPTTDVGWYDFHEAAVSRGNGFGLIDFIQHNTLAMLAYGRYGTKDLQAIIGSGAAKWNENNLTGSTNATGIADTTPETAIGYTSCLGVEGIIGGIYELMDGLDIEDYIWNIRQPDGSSRQVEACREIGWITRMAIENGPRFDMVPIAVGGSGSTYYADFYECSDAEHLSLVAARACFSGEEYADAGISYINATYQRYTGNMFTGTRLAYRGKIRVVESVEEFKSLPLTL